MTIQASDLQKQLPELVGDGSILAEAFSIDADSLNQIEADRLDVFNQMFVEHGTWGLKFWEVFLGIVTDETQSVETRRKIIKNKIIAGSQVFTLKRLVDVLNSYGYTVASVIEKNAEYTIEVQVPNVINTVNELLSLGRYLRIVFPAHLNLKISTVNKSLNAMIDVSEIGPILTVKYDSDLYILGTNATKQLTNITKYQIFSNEFAKDTVVNAGGNNPDYSFDVNNAAAHYSGKIFIPCSNKTATAIKIATSSTDWYETLPAQTYCSQDTPNMFWICSTDPVDEIVVKTKRFVLVDRTTGKTLNRTTALNIKARFWSENPTMPYNVNLNGHGVSSFNADVQNDNFPGHPELLTCTYQYVDKDGVLIGSPISHTDFSKSVPFTSFPVGTHSVEVTVTVKKPQKNTIHNNANGITYSHVLTWVTIGLTPFSAHRPIMTSQNFNKQHMALVNMNSGTTTFYDINTLLDVPVYKPWFVQERFVQSYLKLHVDESNNYLYAIYGYGHGLEATGVYDTTGNNLILAKIDMSTMTVINKKVIDSTALYNPADDRKYDPTIDINYYNNNLSYFPETPPDYVEGTVNDFLPQYQGSYSNYEITRHTSYIDENFMKNLYIVHGYNGDHLVLYSRKVKHYIYEYYHYFSAGYGYHTTGDKDYIGSVVKRPIDSLENTRYPSIKIIDLNNFVVKEVTNEDLLELCRTSCSVHDVVRDPFGPSCLKVSESKAYGIPLVFPVVRPVASPKPPLNGSGDSDLYNVPVPPFTLNYTQLNGCKFVMTTLNKESLELNVRYEYTYNNFSSVNFDPPKEKVPVYPTNIMPDLTMWMDTAYDLSQDGTPAIYVGPTTTQPTLNYLYYASYFGSFYYPYRKSSMAYTKPFDGSIVTSAKVYSTINGAPKTRYSTYDQLYTGHATRDEYGTGNSVYAIYDTSAVKANNGSYAVTNTQTSMGKKLVRMIKVPFNTYQIFQYV